MTEILLFIAQYCAFLWPGGRYRLVDSEVVESFGNAYVVICSDRLCLRFVRDRGQLFLDVREPHAEQKGEWFSLDLFRRLLTGQRQRSAELDEGYAQFLRESLAEIESLFADDRLLETKKELADLKRTRAKEMFG